MRTLRGLATLVAGMLLLTGCIKLDLGLEVNDDGSGTLRMISALDVDKVEELAAMFGDDSMTDEPSIRDQVADIDPSDLPPGATVSYYEDGRFQGVEVVVEFTASDDLGRLVEEALEVSPGEAGELGGGLFDSFRLEPDGAGGWSFSATVPPPDDLGGDDEMFPPEMIQALIGNPEITFSLRLPGRQVEHNATRLLGDGTMVWELDVFGGSGEQALSARTVPGSPITGASDNGLSPLVIALVVVGVVAAVAAIVLFVRNNRAGSLPPPVAPGPAA